MEFVLAHLYRLVFVLCAAIAAASWWLAPAPITPNKVPDSAYAWALPTSAAEKPEKLVAAINGANLWGAAVQAGPQQAPLNDPEWRFVGVTVHGTEKLVLVSIDNQPPQLLKVGDKLPGGVPIVEVHDDHLCLLVKGKKRKLDIF